MSRDTRIGYNCSYMPLEILHSFGLQPFRAMGSANAPKISDTYLHGNMCGYTKAMLNAADGKNAPTMFVDCCESQRRLWDVWRAFVDDSWSYLVPLPRTRDDLAIGFHRGSLADLISFLEEKTSRAFDESRLRVSIKTYNRWRRALRALETLLLRDKIASTDYLRYCDLALVSPPEEATDKVAAFVSLNEDADDRGSDYRILLAGSQMPVDAALVIAETALANGANITYFDTCLASRYYQPDVGEEGDPLASIASAYLGRPPCARMPHSPERFPLLERIVEENDVDGIVYHTLKFCDLFIYEAASFKAYFDPKGIPILRLETDYDFKLPGQARTRLEAFLEML
ncbi:MAG: 2-hydroxyacyl-CoA dehydratase [Chloroflexi bacterium]|nr:2-hydroxyacyl-CoA dehydratase [Chloroflexota bacterium]